jgi:hypothetical protein
MKVQVALSGSFTLTSVTSASEQSPNSDNENEIKSTTRPIVTIAFTELIWHLEFKQGSFKV